MPTIRRPFLLAGALLTPLALLALAIPAAAQTQNDSRIFVRGYGGATFATAQNGGDDVRAEVFGGGFGLNLTRHFSVIADAGYLTNIATEEGTAALNQAAALVAFITGVGADVSLDAKTLYVLGGARFTFGSGRFTPFVEGQGGITRSTFKLKVSSADPVVVSVADQVFTGAIGQDSSTAPVIAAGGGADIRLTHALAAEVGYHYLRLFGDAKANIHQVFGGLKISF
jgi:opacity protein-like surface antigen